MSLPEYVLAAARTYANTLVDWETGPDVEFAGFDWGKELGDMRVHLDDPRIRPGHVLEHGNERIWLRPDTLEWQRGYDNTHVEEHPGDAMWQIVGVGFFDPGSGKEVAVPMRRRLAEAVKNLRLWLMRKVAPSGCYMVGEPEFDEREWDD